MSPSGRIGKYYEITEAAFLGKGSFSKVYLARHTLFGNKVALKVTDRSQIQEDYVLRNLTREASILKKLKHPNIVHFYEDFSHDQLYCLSLELVEGCDLARFLSARDSRRVPEHFAKNLFHQMASAVKHMHGLHILHRDLKQENVLLEHGRVIKIVDFGLSNVQHPFQRLLTHCGSLEYAAPELFVRASVYGPAVDLWSLGVILFSMVTGRMPFSVARGAEDPEHRDKFRRRIAHGLTDENWTHMEGLSSDCCNLLKNLLEPNQCKRIHIRDACAHPWLRKDPELKKNLPQPRPDLKHKYKPQIINWMSRRLGVPQKRIQGHLATYKFEKISAIYYMLEDALMKEVLYQTKFTSKSFVFRITQGHRPTFCDGSPSAELCNAPPERDPLQTMDTIGVQPTTHHRVNQGRRNTFHGVDGPPSAQLYDKKFSHVNRGLNPMERATEAKELAFKKRLGHGDCESQESGARFAAPQMAGDGGGTITNTTRTLTTKFVGNLSVKKNTPGENDHNEFAKKPFRSYKHNRPTRAHAASGHVGKDSLDSIYHSNKEMNKDSVETSDVATDSSTIALNYQRNLQLLNEKYAVKSRRTMRDVPLKESLNKRATPVSEMQESHQPHKDKYFEDYSVVNKKRNYLTKTNLLNSRDKYRQITQHLLDLNPGRILPTISGPNSGFRGPIPATQNKHFQKTTVYFSSNGKNIAHCQNYGPPRAALDARSFRCDLKHIGQDKNARMF